MLEENVQNRIGFEPVIQIPQEKNSNLNFNDEENTFGVVVRSPFKTDKSGTISHTDTPSTQPEQGTRVRTSENKSTTVLASPDEKQSVSNTESSSGGLCESPSSDISVQSEIGWLGTIKELDDILAETHNMFDGSLDDELQQMAANGTNPSFEMGISTMIVSTVEDTTNQEGTGTELFCNPDIDVKACSIPDYLPLEPEVAQNVTSVEQMDVVTDQERNKTSDAKKTIHSCVDKATLLAIERALDRKRSRMCIAALAFAEN